MPIYPVAFYEIKPGRPIPTISNPAVAEGMLQNLPMVVDFAHKYVGDKNAFGFAKGLVKFANKVISESNKAISNAGNGTREVTLPEEAAVPQVDTDTGMGYNGNSGIATDKNSIESIIKNGYIQVDNIKDNLNSLEIKTADEFAEILDKQGYETIVKDSTRSSSGAQIIQIKNPGK